MDNRKVGNARYIKNLNQDGIFQLIHKLGPISRKELAENTGYSSATISNHVRTLLKNGYVIETEKGFSTGGRKPVYLTVNPEKGYIISIDIEVTRIKLALFNLKLNVETKQKFALSNRDNPPLAMAKILTELKQLLTDRELEEEDILGVAVAVPGLVNDRRDTLIFAPNLGWENENIAGYIREEFSVPVVVENEATAAVIGEREFVYPQSSNLVYVSINEGIGCGIILNGKLYRGASGNAGEYGHLIIDSEGPRCHCGNRGCWETLASENFLINYYRELSEEKLSKDKIYSRAETGEEMAATVLKRTGENIGLGLANIINSLSPSLLVIGGGITRGKEMIAPEIEEVIAEKALKVSAQNTEVKFSQLNNLAAIYGLARMLFTESIAFS